MSRKQFIIKHTKSGNCPCIYCGKLQDENKLQPFTLYWRDETEKRGHNEPMCSFECCESYINEQNNSSIRGGQV